MQKIFRQDSRQAKGSALVFSLIVMFIILTAALGVASVAVVEKKNATATGKSVQSFQVADSAIEIVLGKAVTDPMGTTLDSLGSCNPTTGVVTLSELPAGSADVSFKDIVGNPVTACTANLSQVTEVKAVAMYGNTTRSISAAVAAGTLTWKPVTSFYSSLSGWSTYDPANFQTVEYAKDARTGIVYLRGEIWGNGWTDNVSNVTGTTDLFQISDTGFKPPKMTRFSSWGFSYISGVRSVVPLIISIDSDGTVAILSAPTAFISFNGISFATNTN